MSDAPILQLQVDAIVAVMQLLLPPRGDFYSDAVYNALCIPSITSAGTKGYIALKEMLQNGKVGKLVMVESHDLRDVPVSMQPPCSSERQKEEEGISSDGCGGGGEVKYAEVSFQISNEDSVYDMHFSNPAKLILYTNVWWIPGGFLGNRHDIPELDLSRIAPHTKPPPDFLAYCVGLKTFDFSSMSHMTELPEGMLKNCRGLTELDLSPLSKVTVIPDEFLFRCINLSKMDLRSMKLVSVPKAFVSSLPALKQITADASTKPVFDVLEGTDRIEMVYV